MLFSEIRPFVRFARQLTLTKDSKTFVKIPYDARFFYVKDGSGYIEADDVLYYMKKGSAIIINSGIKYILKLPEEQIKYAAFNFDYTQNYSQYKTPIPLARENNFDPKKIIENVQIEDRDALNKVLYVPTLEIVEPLIEHLLAENTKKLIDYEVTSSALMCEILVEALRHSMVSAMQKDDIIEEVLSYIHNNFSTAMTNASIAEKFGFHPNYLSSLVKNSTGLSLKQYIIQTKIMNAVEMLETGAFSIGEISKKCGFYDIYHFSKYFKSIMKVAPSKFTKNN